MITLDKLQEETEKLLALLKDRQPYLMIWNIFVRERLINLHALASEALGKARTSRGDHTSKLDDLNHEVTLAIHLAEGLKSDKSTYTRTAYELVSLAELRLASELECGGVEWIVACRGVILAAVQSGSRVRARSRLEELKAEFPISPKLLGELDALIK
ncbi:MAG: hypothetical protein A3D65_02385 [Candidatus Lloydbacteria bacterium RIFCSPHIGHO2_02_FULL_50_13]|uniref:Uncharacterized protein n=1 Tax=Candidatus Lloydbacteria bacterium RIFCSPHIGHO2_02_FULL_50_13 TaxID=1798661 RepID=A0A1G2D2K8_9BACT|nr:MAG: hypothetical protein A3D65_02385 [Candidatus Lloydbacteria bacterium RIFCSPHIGHO2_02_FULL_50_13]